MSPKKILLGVLAIGVVVAAGWALFAVFGTTRLATVNAECGRGGDKVISVKAKVDRAMNIPLMDASAFKLVDDRDSLWVLSGRGAPEEGKTIRIKGRSVDVQSIRKSCDVDGGLDADTCRILALGARMIAGSCVLIEQAAR